MKIENLTYSNGVMFYTVIYKTANKIKDVLRIATYHQCGNRMHVGHYFGYLINNVSGYDKKYDVWNDVNYTCNSCIMWEYCKARDPSDPELNNCGDYIYSKKVELFHIENR